MFVHLFVCLILPQVKQEVCNSYYLINKYLWITFWYYIYKPWLVGNKQEREGTYVHSIHLSVVEEYEETDKCCLNLKLYLISDHFPSLCNYTIIFSFRCSPSHLDFTYFSLGLLEPQHVRHALITEALRYLF